ncbi:polysaccharide deacetylase family protein [Salibacterium halotolerans]|uniref:Probable sporulation protein, polysaccharide deacetylase family n=1 Tax=Salibacterium halotolerans TaxID=1884432 RepID=A0A1I5MHG1_9BACI|nr:polysaccharide deacetylase family protein [Salibacterium halotolerans]SFP09068.1 probable sporulation protein, polysaccharide deacetylase family [Salibacterium halotolerans]
MKKLLLALPVFLIIMIAIFVNSPPLYHFFSVHNEEAVPVSSDPSGDSLYEKLERAAGQWNEPPRDAVIDKVWKALPGYNGRMVNMKDSYEAMKEQGRFQKEDIVFEQVPPKVHLDDLPPAPVYRGNPAKPAAALMINVSWGDDYIPRMLKVLREEKVKATFFLEGRWVRNQPKSAKMIMEEGHEIGSHAYSHPDMAASSEEEITQQLKQTDDVLKAVLSEDPELFAPPSGSYNDQVVETADDLGMHTILWTVDTVDWKDPEPSAMASRAAEKVENGSLILMHPTEAASAGLREMIEGIRAEGIRLDTVSGVLDETRIDR